MSPTLYGRVDIQKYKTGLRSARNLNILPQGGARNRSGTGYVASAGDSTHSVGLIPFIASTTQAYMIELGNFYMRFYNMDAQVDVSGVAAWSSATSYVIGNLVSNAGINYYCILGNLNQTPPNSTYWHPLTGVIYEIPTPYAAADIFNIKFTQSGDVLYLSHQSYLPQTLTFNSATNWILANYNFINGPFLPQNTDQTKTIAALAPPWVTATNYVPGQYVSQGNVNPADLIDNFSSGNYSLWTQQSPSVGGIFSVSGGVLSIKSGSTTTFLYKALAATYGSFSALITSGTLYFSMSASAIAAATGYAIGLSNGGTSIALYRQDSAVSAAALLTVNGLSRGAHFITVFRHSADGVFTVYVDGTNVGTATDNTYAVGSYIYLASAGLGSQDTGFATFTDIYYDSANTAQNTSLPLTYICLVAHTSGTFATDLGNGDWQLSTIIGGNGITLTSNFMLFQAGHVGALFELTATIIGSTSTPSIAGANAATASIQCGSTYSLITTGTWTGAIAVQASIDGGNTWHVVQTFQSASVASENFNVSGATGFSQCLVRVVSAGASTGYNPASPPAWAGTVVITLTSGSFDWNGIVTITAITNTYTAVGNVYTPVNQAGGIANANATYQWSEGAWSTKQGFPSSVTFFQDRATWGGPQPANVWMSKTASYNDFGVSSPIVASDSINIVLAARQLNQIANLIPMPQALLALTSDSEFGIAPGSGGELSPTSISQSLFSHRGSAFPNPVVIGNEILFIQQMGTTIRNFIFQLAVNGFLGDNISIQSQHLFVGYSIIQMAYQQEPDSIVWAVRSDGTLLSCTYNREQEMQAWTRHDTLGNFESVASIPRPDLGINEVWVVVNRTINGSTVRMIEILKPRDQGTTPSAQWFVDAGTQYNGAPANVITGLSYLNGQNVSILADGSVLASPNNPNYPLVTVAGGQITLPNSYKGSVVTVGLPFVTDMITLDVELPQQDGTLQGQRVKQARTKFRVWNHRGGFISATDPQSNTGILDQNGDSFSDLIEQDRPAGGPDNVYSFDSALPLFTGILDEHLTSGFDYGSHICIRQVDPLPFSILDIIPGMTPGGQ